MNSSLKIKIAAVLSVGTLLSYPMSAQAFVATEGQATHWISPSAVTSTGSIGASSASVSSEVFSEGQPNRTDRASAALGPRTNPMGSPITGAGSYGHSYGEGQQKEPPAFPAG